MDAKFFKLITDETLFLVDESSCDGSFNDLSCYFESKIKEVPLNSGISIKGELKENGFLRFYLEDLGVIDLPINWGVLNNIHKNLKRDSKWELLISKKNDDKKILKVLGLDHLIIKSDGLNRDNNQIEILIFKKDSKLEFKKEENLIAAA